MKTSCGVCGQPIEPTYAMGDVYISNFIPADDTSANYPKSCLDISVCDTCGVGQLVDIIDPEVLYSKYWYYSGVNQTMHDALLNVVTSIVGSVKAEPGDIWLDIASNDGTLLSYVPSAYRKIGIDPADENVQKKAQAHGEIVNDYFSYSAYKSVADRPAKVITCIAMFYDLPNPHSFLQDVYDILDDDGVFVVQISYTPLMLKQLEFGNVCAEHTMYYSLSNLKLLLDQHGFTMVDCELNDINGGSFRVYCTKNPKAWRNQQQRDIGEFRIQSLLAYESSRDSVYDWGKFWFDIKLLRDRTSEFIKSVVKQGKSVYGYGASTKGNTLLQYFGLDNTLITAIADRNPTKWGLKTVGTEIPIISEDDMRKVMPDYLLILPWHFIDEFKKREKLYLMSGGRFIVPSPKFEVISA